MIEGKDNGHSTPLKLHGGANFRLDSTNGPLEARGTMSCICSSFTPLGYLVREHRNRMEKRFVCKYDFHTYTLRSLRLIDHICNGYQR